MPIMLIQPYFFVADTGGRCMIPLEGERDADAGNLKGLVFNSKELI